MPQREASASRSSSGLPCCRQHSNSGMAPSTNERLRTVIHRARRDLPLGTPGSNELFDVLVGHVAEGAAGPVDGPDVDHGAGDEVEGAEGAVAEGGEETDEEGRQRADADVGV